MREHSSLGASIREVAEELVAMGTPPAEADVMRALAASGRRAWATGWQAERVLDEMLVITADMRTPAILRAIREHAGAFVAGVHVAVFAGAFALVDLWGRGIL